MVPDDETTQDEAAIEEQYVELWDKADETLAEAIDLYRTVNAYPGTRCRSLSLAITYAETALLWSAHYEDEEGA